MIFCQNCKYWFGKFCHHPTNYVTVCRPTKSFIKMKDENYELTQNENNNCMLYQRKWWKFWVKELGSNVSFNIEEFVEFAKKSYPEIMMEYLLVSETDIKATVKSRPSRPPPSPSVSPSASITKTPPPTKGVKRLVGLGGII